jgi:hypothetical protein
MGISTRQYARQNLVEPETLHAALSRKGHYFGVVPKKLKNGRLSWPDEPEEEPSERDSVGASTATQIDSSPAGSIIGADNSSNTHLDRQVVRRVSSSQRLKEKGPA